jgi:hypothetical protein
MTQQNFVSPFITRIEDVYQLNNALREAGYQSVFDVIRVPRKQFISQHAGQFGDDTEAVYKLATGFATQISRLYRENELSNNGQPVSNISTGLQGLQQNGPTWLGLFNDDWASYCLSSSPEANDSPVSYLSWLYNQAMTYEGAMGTASIIKLATRRPDLSTLQLDDDAINQVIPSLQLVNEILEDVIENSISGANVRQKLAATRYSNLLPYNYSHDQTRLALENGNESLLDVISQVDITWPYFIPSALAAGNSEDAKELGSDLSAEQMVILTEADNSTATDLTDFYKENFGITATDYSDLTKIDIFTKATGLPVPQVEQLLSASAGGSLAIQSQNYLPTATPPATPIAVDPSVYGSVFVNDGVMPAISITAPQSIEQDGGSNPVKNPFQYSPLLFPHLVSTTNPPAIKEGLFGQSLALYNVANSYAYLDPNSDAVATMNGDNNDFTLGFWVKFSALPSDNDNKIPFFANSDIAGSVGTFCCALKTDGKLYLLCQDSDGKWKNITSAETYSVNTWYYIAFCWAKETRFATLYLGNKTMGLVYHTLNFATDKGYTWVFNDSGNCAYYGTSHPVPTILVEMQYDDIIIANRCLTVNELDTIIYSGLPADGSQYGHYYPLDQENSLLVNLNDVRMDRINRMVRLQRWLELPYDQVDLLALSAIHAEGTTVNSTLSLNDNTLRALGVFRHFQEKYTINAYQFAALINQITPYAITPNVPFFDQLFNSPSLFETPFTITNSDFAYTDLKDTNGRIVKQICAGLQISEAQFLVLAKLIDTGKTGKLNCSLDIVSRFYRLVMLPRWLGLSFIDGLSLLSIIGEGSALTALAAAPVISALDASTGLPAAGDILSILLATSNAADWLTQHGLSASKTYALLQDGSKVSIATNAEVNFINDINQQIPASLLTEEMFDNSGLPSVTAVSVPLESTNYSKATGPVSAYGLQLDSSLKQRASFSLDANTVTTGTADFTIGMWVEILDSSSNAMVICNGTFDQTTYLSVQSVPGIYVSLAGDNAYMFGITDGKTLLAGSTLSYAAANQWSYLTLVFTAATKELTASVYINGAQTATSTIDGSALGTIIDPRNFWTLADNSNGTYYNSGTAKGSMKYDDVSIWTEALTADELTAIAVSTAPAAQSATPPDFTTVADQPVNWAQHLRDLVDVYGLITASATTFDAIQNAVTADIGSLAIPDSVMPEDQIVAILTKLIYQAKVSQSGIAASALAKALQVDHSLPAFLLPWAGSSTYDLLSQSWALSPSVLGSSITNETIPANYLKLLYQVARRGIIATQFELSPAMLSLYLANPTWFGVPDTSISLQMFYAFSRYSDWLKLTPKEDAVLAYLSWVNSSTAPTADSVANALAALLHWEPSEVSLAAAHAVSGGIVKTAGQVDIIMRLQTLSAKTGISVAPLISLGGLSTASIYTDWQNTGESIVASQASLAAAISGTLNQHYRTGLLSYYLGQYVPTQTSMVDLVTTPEDVYEYLLIDPLVTNDVTTSRVAQAISSIQQYINGIAFNMEPGYTTASLDLTLWKEGASQYDIWAGEMELDTYPEDYIDPTLRSTKTTFFKDLETVLNQNQINDDTASDAVLTYLNEFEQVANLEVISGYMAGTDQNTSMYYFLGRTRSAPYTYYWRSLDMSQSDPTTHAISVGAWSEWLEIKLPLSDNTLISTARLTLFNNRLYIAWFTRKVTGYDTSRDVDIVSIDINFSWLLLNGTWSTPMVARDVTGYLGQYPGFDEEGAILNSIVMTNVSGGNETITFTLVSQTAPGNKSEITFDCWLNTTSSPGLTVANYNNSAGQQYIQYQYPEKDLSTYNSIASDVTDASLGTPEYIKFADVNIPSIRLNTLFAKELINKASISIGSLLSWGTQQTLEPALTTGGTPVAMDFNGANGLYFWELFFHMPYLVAWRLNQEQQYDAAQNWFDYIFDPAAINRGTDSTGTVIPNYWSVRPLVEGSQDEPLGDATDAPFDPDAIATAYPKHYQRAIVMAYVSNIIDNADSDYRLLTNDGLSEAKLRYCQAKDLLGSRPDVQLVTQWKPDTLPNIAAATNVSMRHFEQQLTTQLPAFRGESYAAQSVADNPNFVAPLNSQLLGYWNLLDSRLYNLRHNLSIDGTPINVPLYAAPINPTVLMQQSAQGGSLTNAASSFSSTIPPYRFRTMLQSAYSAVNALSQYGQTLLSYYERGDSMSLQEMQQQQMLDISNFTITLQQNNIDSLKADQDALQASKNMAQQRRDHFSPLTISSTESDAMDLMTTASSLQSAASPLLTTGGALNMAPNLFGFSDGGSVLGAALLVSGMSFVLAGDIEETVAQRLVTSEGYRRRQEEWQIQTQQAQSEMDVIDAQLATLTTRQTAAVTALQQAQADQANLQATLSFMKSRFTQASLYTWLTGQLSALYYQAYDAVLSLCLSTQASWQYELGDITTQFIQTNAWNDSYHGLLVGDTLALNLHQMESAWLSRNQRRLEITKTVSLASLLGTDDTTGFLAQLASGTLTFSLSESLFDAGYPGHYLRQLKYITLTLPASVGPYQQVKVMLTQSSSSTLLKADITGVQYLNDSNTGNSSSVLQNPRANQQAGFSHGEDDNGMFVLSFGDERYLPFEGTGAVSSWELRFPNYTSDAQKAIIGQLDDIIVRVHYTALNGGAAFASQVSALINPVTA